MSFLQGVGGVGFPRLPGRFFGSCWVGSLRARLGLGGRARAVGPGTPAPCRPFPAPALRPRAMQPLWPCFQRFPGSGTAVFANFPGKGGRTLSSGGRTAPASPPGAVPGLGRGGLHEVVFFGCKCTDPYPPLLPPPEQLEARARLAARAARPLQHPKMGGRKMGAIAEGEEREMLGMCPLFGRRDSLLGLEAGGACAERVGGERGELGARRVAFRHVLGWGALLPPTRRLGLIPSPGRDRSGLGLCVKLVVTLQVQV